METPKDIEEKKSINRKSLICLDTNETNSAKSDKNIIRKGKLIKGPIWTAYNRESLGSIPRKIENVLLQENKSQKGFLCQSERFKNNSPKIKLNVPGPGSYLSSTMNTTITSFYSTRGFGNGFVSSCDRFNERDYELQKYKPGPGEYTDGQKFSVNDSIKNSLTYKSLYNKKEIKSMKLKKNTPGPGFYNPILMKTKEVGDRALSSFESKVMRFKGNFTEIKFDVPGPGNYFHEDQIEKKMQSTSPSHFFKMHSPKKVDLIRKYIGSNEKDLPYEKNEKYVTKSEFRSTRCDDENKNSTGGFNKDINTNRNTKSDFYYDKNNTEVKLSMFTNKAIFSALKKKNRTTKEKDEDISKLALIYKNDNNNNEEEVKEADIDINNIFTNKKKELFELSPPRWINKRLNHNPGPAYYDPVFPALKKNFNKTSTVWI